jgi:hypothetical protein
MQNAQYFSQTLTEFGVSQQIFTEVPNINFMDFNSVGAKLIHVERGTDITKLTGTFCDYANAHTNPAPLRSFRYTSCLTNWSEHNKGAARHCFLPRKILHLSSDTITISFFGSTYFRNVNAKKLIYITNRGPEFRLRSVHINNLQLTVVKAQSTQTKNSDRQQKSKHILGSSMNRTIKVYFTIKEQGLRESIPTVQSTSKNCVITFSTALNYLISERSAFKVCVLDTKICKKFVP